MKGRDIVIGAAIGVWLVLVSHSQHGQVNPPAAPVASAPPPSASSSPTVSAVPATSLPQGTPAAPAPEASPQSTGTSPGPAVSGGPGWFILVIFSVVMVISVSTVIITAANGRSATSGRVLMEIFLLLAVAAVGISGLYVAATLNSRAEKATRPLVEKAVKEISGKIDAALKDQSEDLRNDLAQAPDLTKHERATTRQFEQATRLISDVELQGAKAQEQLGWMAGQVEDIASRLTVIELLMAGPAAAKTPSGEVSVTEVTDANNPLAIAVLEAESDREREGWDNPPHLYALVPKAAVMDADPKLAAEIDAAPENSLIPVRQKPLPSGEPLEVLASVSWPDDVTGCVLVTELVVLPPEAEAEGAGP